MPTASPLMQTRLQNPAINNILILFLGVMFTTACAVDSGADSELPGSENPIGTAIVSGQPTENPFLTPEDEQTPASLADELSPFPTQTVYPTTTNIVASPDPNNPIPPSPTSVSLVDPNSTYPQAAIQIYRPGNASVVTSPFRVVANLEPGPNGRVHIELFGEDGRTLVRKILNLMVPSSMTRLNAFTEIEFEILPVAESARLVVSVDDDYGRLRALASADLILLSNGITELNRYQDTIENIIVQQPYANVMIQGNTLLVTGLARTRSQQALAVELIDRQGVIVGYGMASLVFQAGEEFGFFAAEINFEVDEPTWVLVAVRELGYNIPGPVHLSSLEIVLSP